VDKNVIRPGQWPLGIRFAVATDAEHVRIAIFNSAGELVKVLWDEPARAYVDYQLAWDGTNYLGRPVTSNVYLIRLFAPSVLLIKLVGFVQ